MKKTFSVVLLVGLVLVLNACGSGGETATVGQASASGTPVVGILFDALADVTGKIDISSIHTNSTALTPYTYEGCDTGNVVSTGSYDQTSTQTTVNLLHTFNACTGTNARCSDITYSLGGDVTSNFIFTKNPDTTITASLTMMGTVVVSGFANFNCGVDFGILIPNMDTFDDSDPSTYSLLTQMICGQTLEAIEDLESKSDAEYCSVLSGS